MNNKYSLILDDCENELNNIQKWINGNRLDSNVKYLTAYAVIKASGTIELVLKRLLFDVVSVGSTVEARNYFTHNIIDASFNPSPDKINRILDRLSSEWSTQFRDIIRGSQGKSQLNSLVGLRNSFAHGTSITVTIAEVIEYYNSGKLILEQLETVLYGDK